MNTITEYYRQSELALASYSTLYYGISDDAYLDALKRGVDGMSQTQAETFASNWRVIDQLPNTAEGFSATVFQSIDDNSYVLSIRGTETSTIKDGLIDWSTNFGDIGADGIAIAQAIDLFNYYQRLTVRQGEDLVQYAYSHEELNLAEPGGVIPASITYTTTIATADGALAGKHVTVTGHSLGGHLALIMSRLAPDFVDSVTTFNAPGFDPLTSSEDTEAFFTLLRNAETAATGSSDILTAWDVDNVDNISNLSLEGDIVSAVGTVPGETQTVTGEDTDPFGAHSIQGTTDTLAVYNLFSQVDPSLSIDEVTAILKTSAYEADHTLESAVTALGELFVTDFTPRTGSEYDTERDDLYTDIDAISSVLENTSGLSIDVFSSTDTEGSVTPFFPYDIESNARTDIAYRYALVNLNPFAVVGANYSDFNQNRELDIYDPATGQGQLSNMYLTYRAEMLYFLIEKNIHDGYNESIIHFVDMGSGEEVVHADPIIVPQKKVVFGSNQGEVLEGQKASEMHPYIGDNFNDALFGGGGKDSLNGYGGDDYIEGGKGRDTLIGGAGNDTYYYIPGDGEDTITDTEISDSGTNHIVVGDLDLSETTIDSYYMNPSQTLYVFTDLPHGLTYQWNTMAQTVLIMGSALDGAGSTSSVNSITINDISSLDQLLERFGIAIPLPVEGAISINSSNPFTMEEQTIADLTSSVSEWGSQSFFLSLNQALNSGDQIIIQVSGDVDSSLLKIVTGDLILDFENGQIILDATDGLAQKAFSLLQQGELSADGQISLTATIVTIDAEGNEIHTPILNALNIAFEDNGFSTTAGDVPETTTEIFGDPQIHSATIQPGGEAQDWHVVKAYNHVYSEDEDGNQVLDHYDVDYYLVDDNGNPTEGGEDEHDDVRNLYDTADNDHFMSGGGDDVIVLNQGGDDFVETGSGEDVVNNYSDGNHTIDMGDGDDDLYTLNGDSGDLTVDGGNGRDYLGGGSGQDIIAGGEGADWLFGASGNDLIYGEEEVDILEKIEQGATETSSGEQGELVDAAEGNDQVFTDAGDDFIAGGDGDDLIVSGGGDDYISGDLDIYTPYGSDWKDWAVIETITTEENNTTYNYSFSNFSGESIGGGDDTIYAGAGNDVVKGGSGDDTIYLESGNDKGWGGSGADIILGGIGDDVIIGDSSISESLHGDDFLDGGDGNDTLQGDGGSDILYGGIGDDILVGDGLDPVVGGDDYLNGEAGNDTLFGGVGNDMLFGDTGEDELQGGDDNDILYGQDGNDLLFGEAGDDLLDGGDGDDQLIGGEGNDTLYGGGENDLLIGDNGDGTGTGSDSLYGGDGDDQLQGGEGNDTLYGDADDDVLFGQDGDDILNGGTGNDQLLGGDGDDILIGGDGDDFLMPGNGNDMMDGGEGDDTYYFALGSGVKHLQDSGGYDRLILQGGIRLNSIIFSLGSLMISSGVSGDELHLDGVDYDNLAETSPIDVIEFSDGQTLTTAEVIEAVGIDYATTEDADTVTGTSARDNIDALGGDDVINSGGGNDIIDLGDGDDSADVGDGNDSVVAGAGADTVMAGAGDDTISGDAGVDTLYGNEGGDLLYGGDDNDNLFGGDDNDQLYGELGDDVLSGDAGHDVLDGGAGGDVMAGGTGDDTYYVDSATDSITEETESGTDLVISEIDYVLGDNLENLQLAEASTAASATGNSLDNCLEGNSLDNTLLGLDGADVLSGGAGADILDGGIGGDTLIGGAGDDQYFVDDALDSISEDSGAGTDLVSATVSYTLADNVENLVLYGAAAVSGFGNILANKIYGNELDNTLSGAGGADELYGESGDDILIGGSGADYMVGGTGNDTYSVDYQSDVVVENAAEGTDTVNSTIDYTLLENVENLTLIGDADISGSGNDYANILVGNAGNNQLSGAAGNDELYGGDGADILNGGIGSDTLYGEGGDDTYVIDSLEDTLVEMADEGNDTVESSVNYTLIDNIENLVLTGSAETATGNNLDNRLTGNDLNNTLDGGAGADILAGGSGDDTYLTQTVGDQILENDYAGFDTEIRSYESSESLAQNVEELRLTAGIVQGVGNDLNNVLIGNDEDNVLTGLAGDDVFDGGAGVDLLAGGSGNDTYIDDGEDVIVEYADEGTDTIESNHDVVLGDNLENVTLRGDATVNATGNALDNVLTGNSANNILDGGLGGDWMAGGAGDDSYYTDSEADTIDENVDSGVDTEIRSHETLYLLDDNVENLILAGTVYRGNGNDLDNLIQGNAADNNLWGREGNDILYGNAGDDQLIGAEGNDELVGGIGDDLLSGGIGNDTLYGGDGADQLAGGAGTNLLRGGLGDDTYVYGADGGLTTIDNSDGGTDWLIFTDDLTSDRLDFIRSADDLIVRIDENSETQVVISNWFLGGDYQIDYIQPANASGISAWTINRMFPPENPEADGIVTPDSSSFDMLWYGTQTGEQLVGTDGADLIRTYEGEDSLFGLAGDDWLLGGSDTDYLEGGDGNDVLYGGEGNDQLGGGAGNDTLIGGTGNDIYVYGEGNGADTINNSGGGVDWLLFTDGVTSDRLTYLQNGDDLIIRVDGDETTQITVTDWFTGSDYQIAYIQPDGENGIPAAQIETLLSGGTTDFDTVVEGTAAAEQLVGSAGKDQLNGYAGDDQLFGLDGADELNAGDGADYLDGGAGDDIQSGGAGDDQLGGDAGNDTLIGGTGDDIYVYRSGSGADTIDNSDGGTDWLIFNDDITSDRLTYLQSGDDLIIRIDDAATSQVTIKGWFVSSDNQLSYVQPSGESAITAVEINDLFASSGDGGDSEIPSESDFDSVVTGTDSAEQVVGTSGADLLQALAGDDQLFGLSGDDWLVAGDGADYLDGGAGDDVQLGKAGNDQLGGDAGNDTLIGGAGDDIYVYRPGSGADTIDNSDGGTDWLIFTDDITADRLSYHRAGDDLQVKVDGNETTMVTVKHWFDGDDFKLSYIQPSGEYGISAASIESMLSTSPDSGFKALLTGTDGGDTLTGSSTADQLHGYDGDDQLSGLAGNDQLSGDDGNDTLYGGSGDDSYLFNLGDGSDIISDESGNDSIVFGDEVTANGFAFLKTGGTLQIGYGLDDQITMDSYSDSATGNRIEEIVLNDGSTMTDADINQLIQEMSAYASTEGISLDSLDNVRNNEELMTMIADSWQAA
ncbi:Ca2+-binding protein, RTX toxin-related [Desulfuromusa kysingii]|uniref:Ca2+-binding protein, RTX toxin-related n=1 Tax=Desulfuromusa kysingii TaxID=37625 RepID=A0A1H4EB71_9BACT|nr:hypothetical protein [Desulfuromusa kysingii]SEA82077.1 Ca2+-binding protein, RTX toxin-related [Desulfuromusa kysingii]